MAITAAQKELFTSVIDEVYMQDAKSFILRRPGEEFFTNGKIKVLKVDPGAGLKEYDGGYKKGVGVTTYEDLLLQQDRAIEYQIDAIENAQSGFVAFQAVANENMRLNVVTEIDAYTFSTIASNAGFTQAETPSAANSLLAYDTALATLSDNGNVDTTNNMVMFISNAYYKALKQNTQVLSRVETLQVPVNGYSLNRNIYALDGIPMILVPIKRFKTDIVLNPGTATGNDGGYSYAGTTKDINFILMKGDAAQQYVAYNPIKIFDPAVNQLADNWLYQFRIFYDLIVMDNKANGIYVNKAV